MAGIASFLLIVSALSPHWRLGGPPLPVVNWIATPSDAPGVAYATAWDDRSGQSALFRSNDGGLSWTLVAQPLAGDTIRSLQPDPRTPSRLFATTSIWVTGGNTSRVYVSEDAGTHWQLRVELTGPCGGSFAFPGANADAIYLLFGCTGQVFVSLDHGTTWTEKSSPTYRAFRIQAALDGSLYATADDGIYQSRDGADSWTLAASPPSACPTIHSFLLDEEDNSFIVAVGETTFFERFVCGGIYRSEDSGQTWNVELDQHNVTNLVRDPKAPTRIFGGAARVSGFPGAAGDVFRSDDDGRSWRSLDLPTDDAQQIGISSDGRRLYASVYGGIYVLAIRKPPTLQPR